MRLAARQPTTAEGELMYQLRIQADYTQMELGEMTGTHFTIWSRFESGARARPTMEHIAQFVQALKLSDEVWDELVRLRRIPDPRFPRLYKWEMERGWTPDAEQDGAEAEHAG